MERAFIIICYEEIKIIINLFAYLFCYLHIYDHQLKICPSKRSPYSRHPSWLLPASQTVPAAFLFPCLLSTKPPERGGEGNKGERKKKVPITYILQLKTKDLTLRLHKDFKTDLFSVVTWLNYLSVLYP